MNEVTEVTVPSVSGPISPYGLAKVVGVPGPMIYTYLKKGYIKHSLNELGKKVISESDANEWITEYFEKNRKVSE